MMLISSGNWWNVGILTLFPDPSRALTLGYLSPDLSHALGVGLMVLVTPLMVLGLCLLLWQALLK